MELFPTKILTKLLENGKLQYQARLNGEDEFDFYPVVKLFTPDAAATWLLTELDPDDGDRLFGLCDLGMQCPELGYVSMTELLSLRGRLGLPVERDLYFTADKPLSEYAEEAYKLGYIKT